MSQTFIVAQTNHTSLVSAQPNQVTLVSAQPDQPILVSAQPNQVTLVSAAAQGLQGIQGERGIQGEQGTGLNLKGVVVVVEDLPVEGNLAGDLWVVTADGFGYVWNSTIWVSIGAIQGRPGSDANIGTIEEFIEVLSR